LEGKEKDCEVGDDLSDGVERGDGFVEERIEIWRWV